jgi:NADPH:quinone reductase-like Zn-dependent oxidoreductase
VSYDGEPGVREFERLNRALRSAKPRIVIGARFPLEQAADAHRAVEGHVLGKVVLKIR